MHRIAPLLLLAPSLVFALGAEDVRFYGVLRSGQVVEAGFLDPEQQWAPGHHLYGSRAFQPLSYCTTSDEVPKTFECMSTKGAKPNLIYKVHGSGGREPRYEDETSEGAIYRSIAKREHLGTGRRRGDATLMTVYKCAEGCSRSVPLYIFEVGVYD